MRPLNAPFFTRYRGFAGGLYPGGANLRPAPHEASGRAQSGFVRPRDAAGNPDPNGRIVLLSIGMSNTTQEFSAFQTLASRDPEKSPSVMLVDGAQGGWSADRIVADPGTYWNGVDQRLRAAGAAAAQVQAAWVKLADQSPSLPFPEDAKKLQAEIQDVVQQARLRFPNLRLAYLSSRIYAGYAATKLNPEPYAYEGGFAVRWAIEAQIGGDPALDFESGRAPWLSWGPYLWADGTTLREDGLVWDCSDLQQDGTHPSDAGRMKVGRMLLDFFKSDTTARPWFVAGAGQGAKPAPAAVVNAAGYFAAVAPGAIAALFGADLAPGAAQAMSLPLPYGLLGTSVTVGGEPAPLYFVSSGQINFVVPAGAADGVVTITREGNWAAKTEAKPAWNSEGLFASPYDNAVAAVHLDGESVSPARPARIGETISIYGTGFGVRNPAIMAPVVLPRVLIGGVAATVQYSGAAHVYPGLDQMNVTLAADTPVGEAVPVRVEIGGFASNTAAIAVAAR